MKLPLYEQEIKTILDEHFVKERIAIEFLQKLLILAGKPAQIEPLQSVKVPLYYRKGKEVE